MAPPRIWDQVIGVFPPYLSLTLIHPEKEGHTHWTDLCHLEEVKSRNWFELPGGYASTGGGRGDTRLHLHWLPLGRPPKGMTIDHVDKNIFNSCVDNLMIKSGRENMHNKTNHNEWGPCVKYRPLRGDWQIQVRMGLTHVFNPVFKSPDQAMACRDMYLAIATAYDRKERDLPTREELVNIAHQLKGFASYVH